MTLTMALTFV